MTEKDNQLTKENLSSFMGIPLRVTKKKTRMNTKEQDEIFKKIEEASDHNFFFYEKVLFLMI